MFQGVPIFKIKIEKLMQNKIKQKIWLILLDYRFLRAHCPI